MIEGLQIDHDKFVDFCILCGCDYCPVVPKIGHITAYKLIQKYNSIEDIIQNTEYKFPEGYLKLFNDAKINFNLYRDKLKSRRNFFGKATNCLWVGSTYCHD